MKGGILNISPRVGKSKIIIDAIKNVKSDIVISAPYVSIMKSWSEEFNKWGLKNAPKVICSRSMKTIKKNLDLLVIDEIQTLSSNQIKIIKEKSPKVIVGLTGTLSADTENLLYEELGLTCTFNYSIDQAIKDGIVANFNIHLIEVKLDDKKKYILSGTKKSPFYSTEKEHYDFLHKSFEKFKYLSYNDAFYYKLKDMYMIKRFNFIYTCNSKLEAAKSLIDKVDRAIVFSARSEQCDMICEHTYHSKNKKDNNLEKFCNEEIDKLGVLEMVNMGITIPNLKTAIVHQMKSNSEMALQKILRTCNIEDDRTAEIYITYYKDTVDENWVMKSLEGVDPSRIIKGF